MTDPKMDASTRWMQMERLADELILSLIENINDIWPEDGDLIVEMFETAIRNFLIDISDEIPAVGSDSDAFEELLRSRARLLAMLGQS